MKVCANINWRDFYAYVLYPEHFNDNMLLSTSVVQLLFSYEILFYPFSIKWTIGSVLLRKTWNIPEWLGVFDHPKPGSCSGPWWWLWAAVRHSVVGGWLGHGVQGLSLSAGNRFCMQNAFYLTVEFICSITYLINSIWNNCTFFSFALVCLAFILLVWIFM